MLIEVFMQTSSKHWGVSDRRPNGSLIGLKQRTLKRILSEIYRVGEWERPASPDHGIWVILQRSGRYTNGLGQTVTVKRRLQRIRVQLDYDKGELSFYNPEHMTHIYTYKHTFTEKLYPFFDIGPEVNAKHPDIKISLSEVSLSY